MVIQYLSLPYWKIESMPCNPSLEARCATVPSQNSFQNGPWAVLLPSDQELSILDRALKGDRKRPQERLAGGHKNKNDFGFYFVL